VRVAGSLRFLGRLLWFNLRAAMAYRAAFVAAVAFMMLNDTMWILFWTMFFDRFPVIRGWTLQDVVTLWAVAGLGYGVAWGFFGNARAEGVRLIMSGRMDYYLSLPRNVLLHFIGGGIGIASLGDALFGVGAFLVVVQPSPARFLLFLGLGACTAVIVLAFGVLVLSLAFWAGNTEGLGVQVTNAMLNFSTYPMDLFSGAVKVALFTLLPAGFASYLPVTIIRDFDALRLAVVVVFTLAIAALATAVFYAGLRRYESGSLVATQG
jgi:ABC-2 type transport system permease protein